MKIRNIYLISLAAMIASCLQEKENRNMNVKPPVAKLIAKELVQHGDKRLDNYYWMNNREDTTVINYLNAENAYREKMMAHTKEFENKLFDEMKGRVKETDESVPYKENGYWYYTRYEEGKEYPVYCRKKGDLKASEEILLNVNDLAKGYEYYQVGDFSVSTDNMIMAYSVDTVSRRQYTIYFKNLQTGSIYQDKIVPTSGDITWANDNKTIFYSQTNPTTLRSERIKRHVLGTSASKDAEVFNETDETFNTGVYKTKSKKYIVIASGSTLSNEYRIADADNPQSKFKIFQPRERELEYSIDHYGDKFYVVTNYNKAKNFQLMETPVSATGKANWKTIIPNREDVFLEGIEVFNDHLVLSERKNALTNLRIINQKTKQEHYINFGESAYVSYVGTNPDFDTNILRFGYQSMTTPASTFDYNMNTKAKTLKKEQEVVGGYKKTDYVTERIYAKAKDGTQIPISLVYKKGIKKDGSEPLLLYAYGSYGYSTDPSFSSTRLSLLDRGFIFAIAHIRGGQEYGRKWYEDGKMFKKKNTFTDFIDCADHLVNAKYTSKDKLFASGGSAGGLLMGAVVNMRPDLWKGVVAAVPFVDVVTTMLDESIPLTTGEFDEWGNPKNKASYDYMKSYSPYDNVEKKEYPAMLVTTGLHDSQVQYWEPAKWVAKLRTYKTGDNPLYLYCNMSTGHGGASGRFERLKETAMQYTFILDQLGIDK